MASMLQPELDNDSVASSPRMSEYDHMPRVRLMCTFGGKILPRPHDNQLSYVGGDNRIVAVHRHISFSSLLQKLSKLSGTSNISVKYQLPNEDLDALISVSTDEDVENMMEEYDRVALNQNPRSTRLRLFLFTNASGNGGDGDGDSRASSISSLLESSVNREQWFLDALNRGGAAGIERNRSEVSSIVSEVPDYLFGLDNPEERDPKPKIRREISTVSDPGSPGPGVSSPFGSTSSAPVLRSSTPELPPVQTKPDNPDPDSIHNRDEPDPPTDPITQQTGHPGNMPWQYSSPHVHYPVQPVHQHPLPVYYVPSPVHPSHGPIQHVPAPAPAPAPAPTAQFLPQYHHVQTGHHHVAMGYHQPHPIPGSSHVYGGPVQQVVMAADGVNRTGYYRMKSPGPVHVYHPGMVVPGVEEQYRSEQDSL